MPGYSQREVDGTQHGGDHTARAAPGASANRARHTPRPAELGALISTIESEVIPRLLLARGDRETRAAPLPAVDDQRIGASSVVAVVDELLQDRPVEPIIDALLAHGATADDIYSQLLVPAARELGERWERDGASFADVTVAVGRLQQLLRELSYDFLGATHQPHPRRSILIAPCPGEQHLFGTLMVCEYFRRAGWEVTSMPGADLQELACTVRNDWFAVVGLAAGSTRQLDSLAAAIRAIRRASVNRAVGIMAGGPAFMDRPDLVARVGADAGADHAHEAPVRAERLLGLLAADCRV